MIAKKMTTKSLICMGLISLMAQSTIMANTPPGNTGFYGGAAFGAGALTGDSKLNLSRFDNAIGAVQAPSFHLDFSDKSVSGDLFLGYEKRINCLHLGIEIIGSLTSLESKKIMDISAPTEGEKLIIKTNSALGAALRFGHYINPTSKFYLKIGLESRRFNVQFTSKSSVDPYINLDKSYRSTAFVPGIGLEVDMTPVCAVRTEYRLALHRKSKLFQANDPAIADRFTSVQIKPTIHYFNVGFVVKI